MSYLWLFLSLLLSLSASSMATGEREPSPVPEKMSSEKTGDAKKLKLMLLIEPSPFTHVSGLQGRFLSMLSNLQRSNKVDVQICTPDDSPERPCEYAGFPIHYLSSFRLPCYRDICLSFDAPRFLAFRRIIQQRPELIHAVTPGFLCTLATFYGYLFDIPLLMSYHTHLPFYASKYLKGVPGAVAFMWWLVRTFHNRADLTLVTSLAMKHQLETRGVQRVEVWKKGVNLNLFHPRRRQEGAHLRSEIIGHDDTSTSILATVGRLGSEKHVDIAIRAMEYLPPGRKVKLMIVGSGPDESRLRQIVASLPARVAANIVFLGARYDKELARCYAIADLNLMPSPSETLGFAAIESLASGVPVIGADAGGLKDVVTTGETGILVHDYNSPKAFADAVESLLSDPVKREDMRKRARAVCEEWGGWEKVTEHLVAEMYPRTIKEHAVRRLRRAARRRLLLRFATAFTVVHYLGGLR